FAGAFAARRHFIFRRSDRAVAIREFFRIVRDHALLTVGRHAAGRRQRSVTARLPCPANAPKIFFRADVGTASGTESHFSTCDAISQLSYDRKLTICATSRLETSRKFCPR